MTNVSGTTEKVDLRRKLFQCGIQALENKGWAVSRIPKGGKASLRQIEKDGQICKVAIRTTQDTWFAFPRKSGDAGWLTLDDVDYVMAVSVDDRDDPKAAKCHLIPGDEARKRFDRAYKARQTAGQTIPQGRGLWLSLYEEEATEPVNRVGAGMGLKYPAIETFDLSNQNLLVDGIDAHDDENGEAEEMPLTIQEAKKRLAVSLGVPETSIKITIEH